MSGTSDTPHHTFARSRGRLRFARTGVITSLAIVLAIAGAAVSADATGAAAASRPALVRIGSIPNLGAGAVALGRLAGSSHLRVDVELSPRNSTALAEYAAEVSTPGTSLYRHYLSRGAFATQFGPTAAAIVDVRRWLQSDGLAVTTISANHLTVEVQGLTASFERAFSTGIERYRLPAGGVAYANTAAPRVDSSVSRYVQGVFGLDDLAADAPLEATQQSRAPAGGPVAPQVVTGGPQPCAAAVAAGIKKHVFTADQLAAAYEFSGLYAAGDEGAGVTIGLFELGPNLPGDITAYQSCFGTSADVTYTQVDGGSGTGDGDGEAALDIETALGLAPKARFAVYQAPRTQSGIIDDFTAMIDDDVAKVITSSWGGCESKNGSTLIAAEGTLFEQGATQGQSVLAATGDYGASDCQSKALDDPASQPYVTGVGGTTLSSIGPPPAETAWNESSIATGAGGGGVSAAHAMPWYQVEAPGALHVIGPDSSGTPCAAASGSYCREVPDVSADANRSTGYLIYYDGAWSPNGGTSAASPLWAALLALADASKACDGRSIGFANPSLYAVAATSYSSVFNDVTSGNNDYTPYGNTSGQYAAGTGYDMATGLGTPKGASLAAALCGESGAKTVATTSGLHRSIGSLTYGGEAKEAFSLTVGGSAGDGQPLGTVHVYSRTTLLCSGVLSPLSGDTSSATCRLKATEVKAGQHADVLVVYSPGDTSSTDAAVRYTTSESLSTGSFTVAKDKTAASVGLSPMTVLIGDESAVKFSVTVRTHLDEMVPNGEHATVHVGKASCVVTLKGGKGTCTLGNRALPVGSYKITDTYSGDANLASARGAATSKLTVSGT